MAFRRAFGTGQQDLASFAQTAWGRDLLSLWRPAGQASGEHGLRLAIRNGTLNFYRRGQSVAKVGFGPRNRPRLDIHIAYVTGERNQGTHYARVLESELTCSTFDGPLQPYEGPATLADWVARADQRKGPEKVFVDDLVTHNANVIDLEMGLSGYQPEDEGKSTSPRMDLVTVEEADGALQIVFWEAKMMGNGELRSPRMTGDPPIIRQLRNYTQWLSQKNNTADVIEAYQASCKVLTELHALARDINGTIGPLGPMIVQAARGTSLIVDDRPRVILRDPNADESWTTDGHEAVLVKANGIQVQLVSGNNPAPRTYTLNGRA